MPTQKDSQNITKRIYLSEENFEKLKQLGVGSSNDKLSTLLDKHEQSLIDQSKPSATASTEPPTDYLLGLIIRYYYGQGATVQHMQQNPDRYTEENLEDQMKQFSRATLKNNIWQVAKENGWHNEYPTFFKDKTKKDSRFLKKLDKCLELLVRHEVLVRFEHGYMLGIVPKNEKEVEKLMALRYQTITNAPPTIYYKKNQKRETFIDGSEVPSIDILK